MGRSRGRRSLAPVDRGPRRRGRPDGSSTASRSGGSLLFGFVDGAQGREWEETKGIVGNNIGYKNAEAMATLHRGFAGRPTRYFLPEVPKDGTGTRTGSMTPDLLPGVKVHILGPLAQPGSDPRHEPARGRSVPASGSTGQAHSRGRWRSAAARGVVRRAGRLPIADRAGEWPRVHEDQVDQFVATAQTDALALAVSLEKAVNGTSLMLAFECGDQMLLFPGDAQWGTWTTIAPSPAKKRLLAATTFLKVGHHGSHNATPRRYVEQISPTRSSRRSSRSRRRASRAGRRIPRPPLLQTLGKHCDVLIRSDRYDRSLMHSRAPQQVALSRGPGGLWTELRLPTAR